MTAPVELTPAALAAEVASRAEARDARLILALAGPPGAGKSTIVEPLRDSLRARGLATEILPMDGFHYDNAVLEARGLRPRKGAPETFDTDGFARTLAALAAPGAGDVTVPVFDRALDLSRGSARIIAAQTRVLLVEGNYLLLNRAPWDALRPVFDLTVALSCPLPVLEARLMRRWLDLGLPEAEARAKVAGNDLPNARVVIEKSAPAEFRVVTG